MNTPQKQFDFSQPLRKLLEIESETLNQKTLADLAHVSAATMSRWVDGKSCPTVSDILVMRDCKRLPMWFREVCAEVTAAGRPATVDEVDHLDANGDGKITADDVRMHDANKQIIAAQRRRAMEAAFVDGRIDREELVEIERLSMEESLLHGRTVRATQHMAAMAR